jgi:AAA family ATP:ADP antiporter
VSGSLREELRDRRVLGLGLLAFLLILVYELGRMCIGSLFLERHTHEDLPLAWLGVAAGAALATGLYQRVSGRAPLLRLYGGGAILAAGILALLLAADRLGIPSTRYLLYVWSDVYVVVLVEIFWTHANAVFPVATAKRTYGLFCFTSSLGGLAGTALARAGVEALGTTGLLMTVPALLGLLGAAVLVARPTPVIIPRAPESALAVLRDGAKVFRESNYLRMLLALVLVTQLVINLVDYDYNGVLSAHYPDTDARTAVNSQVHNYLYWAAIVFQLSTGLILRFLGVPGTLLAVPLVLGSTLALASLVPGFLFAGIAKAASKSLDYSIFRAAKEILYIPLAPEVKAKGKAIIDILGYRAAKAGVSVVLALLPLAAVPVPARALALGLVLAWCVIAAALGRAFARAAAESRSNTELHRG